MLKQQIRICWDCKHIRMVTSTPSYSQATPGDDFSLFCNEGLWVLDPKSDGIEILKSNLEKAENCQEFGDRV